ncbi:MAG: DUF4286 family protein [Anaerolineae bacterium]
MSDPTEAGVLYVVLVQAEEGVEVEWNQWHSATHMPQVMGTGHFTGGSKYRVVAGDPVPRPSFYTFYEANDLDSLAAYFESDAVKALRRDSNERYGAYLDYARLVLEALPDVTTPTPTPHRHPDAEA